jgi:hypothetical protein
MRHFALALAFLPLLLPGCREPVDPIDRTVLRDGCYRDEQTNRAVLRVNGDYGTVLVPGDVREVRLTPRRGRDGNYVEIHPGFTVFSPVTGAQLIGPPEITTRFKVQPGANGPTLMANMGAYGETPLVFGPCPAAPANPPAR